MFDPQDFYFKKAKKQGYKARSIFKLEEIDNKFKIFWKKRTNKILDIGCSPWSWLQYLDKVSWNNSKIIWVDIKQTILNLPNVTTYVQDATDLNKMDEILSSHNIKELDIITSDMAPDTMWFKDIDAIRSLELVKTTFPIYEKFLKKDWVFIIKIFMGPWFDEFIKNLRNIYWWKSIKTFKPQSVRKASKEIYVIKV